MARLFGSEAILDMSALKVEEMQRVAEIIRMAQRAKPKELLAVKAGLEAAFGDDWKHFKPLTALPTSQKA